MKFFSKILFVFCVLIKFLYTQSPEILWEKLYGEFDYTEIGFCVQQTSDGGFIISSRTESHILLLPHLWLIKTDANGDTIWTRNILINQYAEGVSIQQTMDEGYVICGRVISPDSLSFDVLLLKTDEYGNTLWVKIFGGDSFDSGYSVKQTGDGGYIVVGSIDVGNSYYDVWLIKADENGDSIWTRTYGGDKDDNGYSIEETDDGGFIIVGSLRTLDLDQDVWLLKTDSSGDTLWTKTYGGIKNDVGNSVQQTSDGGYIIVGRTRIVDNIYVYLIKTNENGDTLWTKIYGGTESQEGMSVQQTTDGGYIIGAVTESFNVNYTAIWLIKTDSLGDTLWTKILDRHYHDEARGECLRQTKDNGYIVSGSTYPAGSYLKRDVWLIKIAPDSNVVGNEHPTNIPINYDLSQNHPNPFNTTTKIKYQIPTLSFVTLKVYDVLGNEIETLVREEKRTGTCEVTWYAENLPSGVYFYQLKAKNFFETKKMVLLR